MERSCRVVGRLAPSPTGAQHLGNARTYLIAFWANRAAGGRMILRIEDIDSPRVKSWATEQAVADLRWLGITWDEGPDVDGPRGPYIQTARTDHYRRAIESLRDMGCIYPCTCSRKDIALAASAPHGDDAIGIYPGTCATWRPGDPLPAPGTYCWRYRVSRRPLTIHDRLAGEVTCVPSQQLGDFPVTRKSGEAAYQLAVVVDDIAMGINQVVRGDDLLTSTFWQRELFDRFGSISPAYAHVPLVVGGDGRRLAKRHGDTRLSTLRETGVGPHSIVAWAATSAGLLPAEDCGDDLTALHTRAIANFDWDRLHRRPTVVDPVWTHP